MRQLDKATIAILLVMFLIIGLAVQEQRGESPTNTIQTETAIQAATNSK